MILAALLAGLLAAARPAAAEEPDPPAVPEEEPGEDAGSADEDDESVAWESPDLDGFAARLRDRFRGPWTAGFSLRPTGGWVRWTVPDATLQGGGLGVLAAVHYQQVERPAPVLWGRTRAVVLAAAGPAFGSTEARLGSFLGPGWSWVGVQTGPDLFYNRLRLRGETLPDASGVAWPLIVAAGPPVLSVYGGMEPAWYLQPGRLRVLWRDTDLFGFGHRFAWLAGLTLAPGPLRAGLSWQRTITGDGVSDEVGLSLRFGG